MDKPLLLADHVVFTCQNSGACCRGDWLIGVDEAAHQRLTAVDWSRHDPVLGAGTKFTQLPFPLPSGEATTFARTPSGGCVFLTGDARCGIHRHLGHAAKPQVCREFPYHFVDTPDGVAVGVSFACTAVRAHRGASLPAQRDEIAAVLAGSRRVGALPEPLTLYGSIDMPWAQYRPLEQALLELLGEPEVPLPLALLTGSALISLCVGLSQVEARARREERPPAETIVGALDQLRAERYRRLLAIAAGARYPRRPSHAYLAPLYTWLAFSRRRLSRLGLVAALYRNYVRFRRNRGSVPDLVGGGPPVDLAALASVRFDVTVPGVEPFLREYWSHVVFRKTLIPMHGVFRGYQTLLALYSFTKWAARIGALRAGRAVAGRPDVEAAVRLVEQRFVLHARFTDVFALSPVFVVLADRLYRQPAFVRAAALDPES